MKSGRATAALVLVGVGFLSIAACLRSGAAAQREIPELSTASPGVRFVSVALGGFRGLHPVPLRLRFVADVGQAQVRLGSACAAVEFVFGINL